MLHCLDVVVCLRPWSFFICTQALGVHVVCQVHVLVYDLLLCAGWGPNSPPVKGGSSQPAPSVPSRERSSVELQPLDYGKFVIHTHTHTQFIAHNTKYVAHTSAHTHLQHANAHVTVRSRLGKSMTSRMPIVKGPAMFAGNAGHPQSKVHVLESLIKQRFSDICRSYFSKSSSTHRRTQLSLSLCSGCQTYRYLLCPASRKLKARELCRSCYHCLKYPLNVFPEAKTDALFCLLLSAFIFTVYGLNQGGILLDVDWLTIRWSVIMASCSWKLLSLKWVAPPWSLCVCACVFVCTCVCMCGLCWPAVNGKLAQKCNGFLVWSLTW